jgi:hypothetical protein
MRAALVAVALALALALVPSASAAGPSITYSVSSGTPGNPGWYLSDVTAQITVQGATDSTCTPVKTFRSSADTLDCSATDGSSTVQFHLQFKIDKDAPVVTGASADRGPDRNGWYNHPLSVQFAGSDATSGIASCTTVPYAGPDNASASVSGTCRDVAGNVSAAGTFALKYDATAPSVSASAARAPDSNGWYSHPVGVGFSGTDAGSGLDSCTGAASYSGPDTAGTTISGTCTDAAGNSAGASLTLRYDATPPTVTVTPEREPDSGGWYNRPVAVSFAGADGLSGLAGCDGPKTYSGPDVGAATVTGGCRDNAGNAATGSLDLRYDATPPKLSDLAVAIGAGSATLSWKQPADTTAVEVVRSPGRQAARASMVFQGHATSFHDGSLRAGVAYRYTLTSRDAAGNSAVAQAEAVVRALYAPAAGARAAAGTLLRWTAVPKAAYYNVQLFRDGKKLLTTWTSKPQLRLPRQWQSDGKHVRLVRGRYRWYVWPGIGKPAAARYGKLLGSSTFVVR